MFDTTTLVDVTKPGYVAVYNLLFGIAVFVMLIFFCLQLITGLVRRDPTALTRAALGLAKSVLGSFVVITLTALLLEVVDQLCIGIVQAAVAEAAHHPLGEYSDRRFRARYQRAPAFRVAVAKSYGYSAGKSTACLLYTSRCV